jgi:hypothetical protein
MILIFIDQTNIIRFYLQDKTRGLVQNKSDHTVIEPTDQGRAWTIVSTSQAVETPISNEDFSKVLHSLGPKSGSHPKKNMFLLC